MTDAYGHYDAADLGLPSAASASSSIEAERKLRREIQRLNEHINLLVRDKTVLLSKVESLEEDQAESDDLRERMAELLRGTANALKGTPGPLQSHDWSDLPEVAAAVVAERDAALNQLRSQGIDPA